MASSNARIAAILLWLLAPGLAAAQQGATLLGQVVDPQGGAVSGAAVRITGPAASTVALTDEDGQYRAGSLPAGMYLVAAERLGFERSEQSIRLAAGETRRLDFQLMTSTVLLEGVVVDVERADDRERSRFETDPGVTARVVRAEELRSLPGLAEPDVLRAVAVLPGVVTTSDFSSAFNVRGGSADQNLILLDGFPIFNPFHLGGLFSVFNSDAVERAELLTGGFGAEYGGRVSSVLTVETRGVAEDAVEVAGGVSLLAARLMVRSKIPASLTDRIGVQDGSWLVSARRSYFDQILRPITNFPYHLTDFQGHVRVGLRGGGNLSLTAYGGADALDLTNFELPEEDSTEVLRVRWTWGNRLVGLRWIQPLGAGWTSDARIGYSRFGNQLRFVDFDGMEFTSRIAQRSAHLDLSRQLGSTGALKFGAALEGLTYDNLAVAGGTPFLESADDGMLGSAYGSLRVEPLDGWLVESGVRFDLWAAAEERFARLSPRLAVKYFFGEQRNTAVKVAAGRYVQFLHSLRDESLPVSNDTWIVAGQGTPAVVSDQVQLGVDRYWGAGWSASIEGYYRRFDGVTEFNLADDPNDPFDDMLAGHGQSIGLDLLLRRNTGRLTGWSTISLLRAERTFPDPTAVGWEDLPADITFPPVFDRRVDVDLVLQYEAPKEVEVGLRWNFGSPLPYTRPIAQYYAWTYSPIHRRWQPASQPADGPPLHVWLGDRNAERYPAYHRLDLSVRRTFQRPWGEWTPYLQVLNAYNRRNVLWYFYNYDKSPPTRSGLSMFPVLPAIGVEMSF